MHRQDAAGLPPAGNGKSRNPNGRSQNPTGKSQNLDSKPRRPNGKPQNSDASPETTTDNPLESSQPLLHSVESESLHAGHCQVPSIGKNGSYCRRRQPRAVRLPACWDLLQVANVAASGGCPCGQGTFIKKIPGFRVGGMFRRIHVLLFSSPPGLIWEPDALQSEKHRTALILYFCRSITWT
jgi:hypothetical protein